MIKTRHAGVLLLAPWRATIRILSAMIAKVRLSRTSTLIPKLIRARLILAAAAMTALALPSPWSMAQASSVSAAEAQQIARQAYTFAYPLVLMEMTRRAATQDGSPHFVNHFSHAPAFPDDRFRQVIRPNADTLYSTAWLDLSKEPILLHLPDTKGRYYLFQLMDAWTETIVVPGKRTTGTGEGWFAIVGPGWKGSLPAQVQRIDCPNNMAWLLGRTQTNSARDYDFVHGLQQGYRLAPLSAYPQGQPPLTLAELAETRSRSLDPPPVRVAHMSASEFFQTFALLLEHNPAHSADEPMLRQLAQIGLVAGKPFPAAGLPPEVVKAIEEGARSASDALESFDPKKLPLGKTNWTVPGHYGRYATNYPVRAFTARYLLGALPAEDAVYYSSPRDSAGQPFDGSKRYVLHFDKSAIPPVRAFWSLTLYDDQGYFTANALSRYAIGDRDPLKFNADGSLDLYIQHDAPGGEKDSNWLPAPAGAFNLALRLYWPSEQVVNGAWTPPAVNAAP
jgi:hypothetical protein